MLSSILLGSRFELGIKFLNDGERNDDSDSSGKSGISGTRLRFGLILLEGVNVVGKSGLVNEGLEISGWNLGIVSLIIGWSLRGNSVVVFGGFGDSVVVVNSVLNVLGFVNSLINALGVVNSVLNVLGVVNSVLNVLGVVNSFENVLGVVNSVLNGLGVVIVWGCVWGCVWGLLECLDVSKENVGFAVGGFDIRVGCVNEFSLLVFSKPLFQGEEEVTGDNPKVHKNFIKIYFKFPLKIKI